MDKRAIKNKRAAKRRALEIKRGLKAAARRSRKAR
jgi:hypothetical protein